MEILCGKNAVISDLNDEEIVVTFYKKELQKTNQKEFGIEKVIKRKVEILSNEKVMIIHLIIRLIKKILLYKMSYFPEPYTCI